jgi:hypothetical protein
MNRVRGNLRHLNPPLAGRVLHSRVRTCGFTLLELQIAVLLLAFGMVTLASLMTTQSRVLNRLQGDFKPSATLCVTRSNDPWVRKLGTPARITAAPVTLSAPPGVTAVNDVTIVTQSQDMLDLSITVTADVTLLP